ncbi:hypothetical protein ACJ5H2_05385 [Nocardioides sp. R1-1]|uniref:hypothetical protein n=1 Tax=Nocardioides sp. R1-1 TaxID=3383502 RepID=UPI0038D252F4
MAGPDEAQATTPGDTPSADTSSADTSSADTSSGDRSTGDGDRVAYYDTVLAALPDPESFTVLVVAGARREEVAQLLGVDLTRPVAWEDIGMDELDETGWALVEIEGGVLAVEPTGFGDPAVETLRALSAGGRAAAVLTSNIEAFERFGAARNGELLFDAAEFMYIEDPEIVPAEIRPLFDLVWDDLKGEPVIGEDGPNSSAVAMAMSEVVTRVVVTADDMAAVTGAPYFSAPSLVYAGSDE